MDNRTGRSIHKSEDYGVQVPTLEIDIGYRKIHANITHKDDSGNFTLSGPYIELLQVH